jgi:predicted PurR-regulated permease PerM
MFPKESNLFLSIIFLVALGFVLLLLSGFATPLVLGALLATITHTFYKKLVKNFRGNKTIAALLVLLIIVLIIIIPFFGILTLLVNEAFDLVAQIQNQLASERPFGDVIDNFSGQLSVNVQNFIENNILPNLSQIGSFFTTQGRALLTNATRLGIGFFVLFVTIFYLLRDGDRFGKFLDTFSPLKHSDNKRLYQIFKDTGQAIFFGNFVSAIAQGFVGGLGFFIFGLTSPLFWGTIMAFLALIPLLGPYIIAIPAAIYLFAVGKTGIAIGFLLYNILIVSTVDNIVKPILIGDKIKVHPLFILLAILGGIKIFGLMGIVYGPLIAAVFMSLVHVAQERGIVSTTKA